MGETHEVQKTTLVRFVFFMSNLAHIFNNKRNSIFSGFAIFLIIGVFFLPTVLYPKTARAVLYAPGETLEPACGPTDSNCGIATYPVTIGTSTAIGSSLLTIQATSTGSILATLRAFVSQVANIFQVQDSSGNNLFSINGNGVASFADDVNVSGTGQFNSDLVANGPNTGFTVTNNALISGALSVSSLTTLTSLSVASTTITGNFVTPMGTAYSATGTQNNVDFGTGSLFQYNGSSTLTITGIAGGTDGRFIRIMNNSAYNITIANNSASSTASNQISTPSGTDVVVGPQVSVGLQYDVSGSHWHIVVLPATSGSVASFAFLNNGNSFGATASLGTADANVLQFITSSSTRFTVASGSATFTGTGTSTFASAAGSALNVLSGTTGVLTLDSGSTGAVNIGTGSNAKTITIGNTTGATGLVFNSGSAGISFVGSSSLQNFTAINGTTTNLTITGASNLGTVTSGTWNGLVIASTYGGTGQTGYTTGDILYASNSSTLTKLSVGSIGTVLKISAGGLPSWGADLTSGGGSSFFASSTNGLFLYPSDTSQILVLGASVTSTTDGSKLQVTGSGYFTGGITLQNATATSATISGALRAGSLYGDAQNVTFARIASSTFSTLQQMQNVFHSAGYTSGGTITDNGNGTVSVASGTGLFRASNSNLSTIYFGDWIASSTVTIATDTVRYIGVEYNSGSPRITVRTSSNWDYKTDWPLGEVANENGILHIANDFQAVGDHAAQMIWRDYETMPLERDERNGGLVLSESGDGNRHVSLTAGTLWQRLTRYPISATSTFDTYVGMTKYASATTTWDNANYNSSGTLTALTAGKYAVLWFYVETNGRLVQVYGTNQYATVAAAANEDEPMDSLPLSVMTDGKLVGRIIFQKGATTASSVDSAFNMNSFNSTALTYLSNLQGLDYNSSGLTGFVASGGITGGQTIIGGTNATSGLTLQSTSATGTTDFIKFLVGANGGTEAGRFTNTGAFSVAGLSTLGNLSVTGTSTLQGVTTANATATSLTVTNLSTLTGGFIASASSSISGALHISAGLSTSSTLDVAGASHFYSTGQFDGALTLGGAGTGLSVTNTASIGGALSVTGLATVGNLSVTGTSTLQNFTAATGTLANLIITSSSTLGTVTSGTWNGLAIGSSYGGTNQTSWTKGDILYASANDVLAKLPIGSTGNVLTVSAGGVPVWGAAGGGGGGGSDHWATSTTGLLLYPVDPGQVVLVGASATTTAGTIFEVTGNSYFAGSATTTGTFTTGGNLFVNGGSLVTNQTSTANLFNTNATTLNIGGAATAINLGAAGATITGGGALSIQSGSATALLLDSGTTGAINIGTTSTAKIITIGNTTGTTSLVLNAGTGNIDVGTSASARSINIGTGAATQTIVIGSTSTASGLAFNSGTGSQTHTSFVATGTGNSAAFVFNASALTTGTAFRLTSNSTSGILFDQNVSNTSGTIDKVAYGSAATLNATTTGLSFDLNTNVTATGISMTGITLATAADTNIANATKRGLVITSGALTQNTSSATGTYAGVDITIPTITLTSGNAMDAYGVRVTTGNITQTAGTLTENGLFIDQSGSTITSSGTINGINISPAGVATGTLNGVRIGSITGGNGTETALHIGSGWDTDLRFGSTAPKIAFGDTGTLAFTDGSSTLVSIIDQGAYGTLKLSDKGSAGDPATCTTGEMYFNATDRVFKGCTATNTWTSLSQTDNVKITSESTSDTLSTSNTNIGIAVSITPRSPTSEILLNGYVTYIGAATANTNVTIRVRRGTLVTDTLVATSLCGTTDSHDSVCSWTAVDSPATSSAVTYTVWAQGSAANGTMTQKSNMAMEVNVGADIAELYGTNDTSITMGDVVSLDTGLDSGVAKSTHPYDNAVLGVVSTRPAVLMGSDKRAGSNAVPVALAGRVPVKVSTVNGVIKAGDYLTTSDTPGVAMKATHAGPVIGQALNDYVSDSDMGVVTMFVKNGFYDGQSVNGTSTSLYSFTLAPVLLGDISQLENSTGTISGLSGLVASIQSESAHDPIALISKKITDGTQFLTDFVSARVTAIRGYFDEVFTKKIHTEQLCVKKSDGSEVCVTGDQVDSLLQNTGIAPIPAVTPPAPAPEQTSTPPVVPVPENPPAPSDSPASSPDGASTSPEPLPSPAPEPAVEQSTSVGDPAPPPNTVSPPEQQSPSDSPLASP